MSLTVSRAEAQRLFDIAKELQSDYWTALSDLEEALGVDIEGSADLATETIDSLIESGEDLSDG